MSSSSPYQILKALHLDEIGATLTVAEHIASGATVVHIGNSDPENLFCLSFRTYPQSSNGAPHILEHTVLCGSHKFPLRDPFFSMTRRSMATFMNAMTGDDLTFYPASSQIPKDFYNLLDVYIDAVFAPNLSRLSFLQEGHRLEFAEPNDPSTRLEIKGIVYNEMKGALSSPDSRLYHSLMKALFPDTPYGFNSGGEPEAIRTLTYEQLVDFHRAYYHPSRCTFFFSGNWPLADHLAYLEERLLSGIDREEPPEQIQSQPRFDRPKVVEGAYPAAGEEQETMVAIGALTCAPTDLDEVLALEVVDLLLMATDASPLKRALLRSGLCKQASSYIDCDNRDVPWLFFMRGVEPGSGEQIERIFTETIEQIEPEWRAIEAAVHQLEFDRSEITGDGHPYGLALFGRTVPLMQQGGNPEDGLLIHSLFEGLLERCKQPNYLRDIAKRYLVDNPHRVRLEMEPDGDLDRREAEDEERWLAGMERTLSEQQREEIRRQALLLAKEQETEEDLSLLPKLDLADVPKEATHFPLSKSSSGCYHHDTFTNQISYLSLSFDLPEVSECDLPWVRLFARLSTQVGSGGRDYIETLDQILEHTGGIDAHLAIYPHATNFHRFRSSLSLTGRALRSNVPQMCDLMREIVTSCDFSDRERIAEVIKKHHTGLEQGLARNALPYATSLAASTLSVASHVAENWWGLDYLRAIRGAEDRIDELIDRFESFKEILFSTEGADLILSSDAEGLAQLERIDFGGLGRLEQRPFTPLSGVDDLPQNQSQGIVVASPVAFTCKMVPAVSYNHPDSALLSLLSRLMVDKVLHKRIREQGGAYGGGASNNPISGHFSFYAYRDPNLASTLDAFDEAIEMATEGQFDADDLEEAKLRLLQKIDSPISPGSRAIVAYGRMREGKSDEMRQHFRDRILSATCEEVSEAAERHIKDRWDKAITVAAANRDFLVRENEQMEAALPIVEI